MEKDFWSFIARQTLARSQDFLLGRAPQNPLLLPRPLLVLLPWSVALAIMLQQQEKILTFIACANELVLLRLQQQQQQLQLLQLRLRLLLVLPVFPVPSTFVGRQVVPLSNSCTPHSLILSPQPKAGPTRLRFRAFLWLPATS